MQAASFNPTFGIEIECLYLYSSSMPESDVDVDDQRDEESDEESEFEYDLTVEEFQQSKRPSLRGPKAVWTALQKPLPIKCATCLEIHEWSLPLNSMTVDTRWKSQELYRSWSVMQDSSLKLTREERAMCTKSDTKIDANSIEVVSRILPFQGTTPTVRKSGTDHMHEITAEEEIEAVYARLHEAFNKYPGTTPVDSRLVINSSCSTHVHVGNGQEKIPLATIKNMLSTKVACEKIFDSLHSTSRIGGSTLAFKSQVMESRLEDVCLQPEEYNGPWSSSFMLGAFRQKNGTPNPENYPTSHFDRIAGLREASARYDISSWLKLIQSAPDELCFRQLQGESPVACTTNRIRAIPTMTVEFRQSAGTLVAAETLAWREVCVRLMEFSSRSSETDIAKLCRDVWASPLHTADDLLLTLGVSEKTRKHYQDVIGVRNAQHEIEYGLPLELEVLDMTKNYEDLSLNLKVPSKTQNEENYDNEWEDYAAKILKQELEVANLWPQSNALAPLVEHLIRDRCAQIDSKAVAARIHKKLTRGCYGQFEADYLATFETSECLKKNPHPPLSDDQREKLTIR